MLGFEMAARHKLAGCLAVWASEICVEPRQKPA